MQTALWYRLESGKRYAVTLNYKIVNNNGNSQDATYHLPQIAIGYDGNGSSTSTGRVLCSRRKKSRKGRRREAAITSLPK